MMIIGMMAAKVGFEDENALIGGRIRGLIFKEAGLRFGMGIGRDEK